MIIPPQTPITHTVDGDKQRFVDELVIQWKSKANSELDSTRPIESVYNSNYLRYRVKEEKVEALIFNNSGEVIKTIPASDLEQLMKENIMPTLGKMLDKYA